MLGKLINLIKTIKLEFAKDIVEEPVNFNDSALTINVNNLEML